MQDRKLSRKSVVISSDSSEKDDNDKSLKRRRYSIRDKRNKKMLDSYNMPTESSDDEDLLEKIKSPKKIAG